MAFRFKFSQLFLLSIDIVLPASAASRWAKDARVSRRREAKDTSVSKLREAKDARVRQG